MNIDLSSFKNLFTAYTELRYQENNSLVIGFLKGNNTTNTRLTKRTGWSQKGRRYRTHAPFGHWKTQTFIAGLRCHGMDRHYVGPSFQQIAARYRDRADAVDYLAGKIRNGSVGDWGRIVMPRHPQIAEGDARRMAEWVLAAAPAAR